MTEAPAKTEFGYSPVQWGLFALVLAALAFAFRDTISFIYANWHREEFSHGFLIPVVSLILIWQRHRLLQQQAFRPSWFGVLVVLFGLVLFVVAEAAAISVLDTYALILALAGALLAIMGWRPFRIILPAVLLMFLMIPLPEFLFSRLSSALQLISSQIGVGVIRLFGISVFLEGNVIDLGTYKLQVVEACSGLRYLFPLLTLGVILASLIRMPLWIRVTMVASTVPITILMNSFRIGVIGVLVEHYGIEQAEGFLHDFEGWVIFMACFSLLLIEVWVILRLSGDRRSLRDIFVIDWPAARPSSLGVTRRTNGAAGVAAVVLLLFGAFVAVAMPARAEVRPARTDFTRFPMQIAQWSGRRESIESMYLDILKLDDYVLANYAVEAAPPVNLYVAYYESQRGGRSAHSPSSCQPGGGWRMSEFRRNELPGLGAGGTTLPLNRVIIEQGEQRQLVYYWFKQRERVVTNEYLVKWYLLWDSLIRNRSDGALVRLITPLAAGEQAAQGDARLVAFAHEAVPNISGYVPD
jgi:exosortase D (VPLPA-CTERM-specific)